MEAFFQQQGGLRSGRPGPLLHGKFTGLGGAPKIAVCSKIGPLAGAPLCTDTPTHQSSPKFCSPASPSGSLPSHCWGGWRGFAEFPVVH